MFHLKLTAKSKYPTEHKNPLTCYKFIFIFYLFSHYSKTKYPENQQGARRNGNHHCKYHEQHDRSHQFCSFDTVIKVQEFPTTINEKCHGILGCNQERQYRLRVFGGRRLSGKGWTSRCRFSCCSCRFTEG